MNIKNDIKRAVGAYFGGIVLAQIVASNQVNSIMPNRDVYLINMNESIIMNIIVGSLIMIVFNLIAFGIFRAIIEARFEIIKIRHWIFWLVLGAILPFIVSLVFFGTSAELNTLFILLLIPYPFIVSRALTVLKRRSKA